MCYLCVSRVRRPAFRRNSAQSPPFCLVLCFLGPLWSPTSRESRQRRVWCLLAVSVSRVRCPAFRRNSAESPPMELILCVPESLWSQTVRERRRLRVGAILLFPRLRAQYRAVSITWPHCSRLSSLLVFWNLRCLMRPASATFGHVWVVWRFCGCSGAPQAAEKILERTCVQF